MSVFEFRYRFSTFDLQISVFGFQALVWKSEIGNLSLKVERSKTVIRKSKIELKIENRESETGFRNSKIQVWNCKIVD